MTDQVRRPLPARLSWETERSDRYNRAHWLVITELGMVEGEPDLEAHNTVVDTTSGMPLGINMIGQMVDGSGLRVLEVGPDSMASAAGMIDDDTIVEVDGTAGPSVEDLRQALVGFAPGEVIPLVVQRGAERIEIAFAYPVDAAPRGRQAFPRTGRARPGRAGSAGQRRHRVHPRGPAVHAADLAGAVRLHPADHGGRQRGHGVRRHGRARHRRPAAVGRHRSGPHGDVRRGAGHRRCRRRSLRPATLPRRFAAVGPLPARTRRGTSARGSACFCRAPSRALTAVRPRPPRRSPPARRSRRWRRCRR